MTGRKSPNHPPEGQSGLHLWVIGNILIIIKVDEFMIPNLPKDSKGYQDENQTDDEGQMMTMPREDSRFGRRCVAFSLPNCSLTLNLRP
jgi:hypothetical protein